MLHVFMQTCLEMLIHLVPLFLQVFYPGYESPVFFVANRGHHADIGGITPGKYMYVCMYNIGQWQGTIQYKCFSHTKCTRVTCKAHVSDMRSIPG